MSDRHRANRERVTAQLAHLDELELTVEKLVSGGDGLARYEGIPIFVARSAPGDRLRVRVVERRPDYARAEILEVLEPGAGRREPPCPVFDRCGGCDLQHLEDDVQTRLKAAAAVETLTRLGRVSGDGLAVDVIHGAMWGYRTRAQLHTEAVEGGTRVGYYARGSQELVPVDACPILTPALEALVAGLPQVLGETAPRRLDLLAGTDDRVSVAPVIEGLPHGVVQTEVGDLSYALDARCFFQSHRDLVADLVERAVGPWSGGTAIDLYAGVGLLSLPLASRYEKVIAVEGDPVAARFARTNARRNRRPVEVVSQAVESWVRALPASLDRIVVDPPRSGLTTVVRDAIATARPARVTYVSCHAATLARDLRAWGEAFAVESVTFLDLFPQTGHLETIVQLVGEPD